MSEIRTTAAGDRACKSDLDLAAAAAGGDERAKMIVAKRLLYRVRRLAGYLVGPGGDVDDLAQGALVEVVAALGSYRGDGSLEGWAGRIASRTIIRGLKHRKTEQVADRQGVEEVTYVTPEKETARRQLSQRLAVHMGALNEERRIALVLHHVQGYTIAEIATMTNARPNTVRDRLREARKQLRKRVVSDPEIREYAEQGLDNGSTEAV